MIRTEHMIGGAGVGVLVLAAWFALLSPQQAHIADLHAQAERVSASNAATQARLPALRSELATITGQVDTLRLLSAQVPPEIDLPELYQELDAAAVAAGITGGAQGVSVTTPVLVSATPSDSKPASAPAATDDAGAETAGGSSSGAATPSTTATLASFEVTMTVRGSVGQVVAFLDALRTSTRLSVVHSSSLSADQSGVATMQVKATYYLQQVDVASLVQQIEDLETATSDGATKSPADSSSSAPTAAPSPSPTSSRAVSP